MSKWMDALLTEIEKNKSGANPPMSVLSAPFGGYLQKNNGVLDHKIENLSFQPMSALSVGIRGLLEKLEKNESVGKLPMSVLSVASKGVSLKFNNNIQNIFNNPLIPTDKADIGSVIEKKHQHIDFDNYFCASDLKNICNNLPIPADKTDIGGFSGKNPHLIDFTNSFAGAIEVIATRNRPKQIRESRWAAIVKRLNALVCDEKHHILKIIGHGWPLEEVFGCHRFAPDARIDGMGLLMVMGNSRIAEVQPRRVVLKSRRGSMLSYYLGAMNRNLPERSTLMEIE